MIHTVDPQQNALFDSFAGLFSAVARKLVEQGWQGAFRHVILALLPVDALAGSFDPVLGRPTKELYSMAGLMLLMEFNDWTHEEAVHRYMFGQNVQYALDLPPAQMSLSSRTLERYLELFRDNDVAMRVLDEVTQTLVDLLELDVSWQRLDSKHVFSNRERYTKRAGIESTNSGLKRRTRLGRLRVRGKKSVFHAIYMKVAGWNILRAAVTKKMKAIVVQRILEKAGTTGQETQKNSSTNPRTPQKDFHGRVGNLLRAIFRPRIGFHAPSKVAAISGAA